MAVAERSFPARGWYPGGIRRLRRIGLSLDWSPVSLFFDYYEDAIHFLFPHFPVQGRRGAKNSLLCHANSLFDWVGNFAISG